MSKDPPELDWTIRPSEAGPEDGEQTRGGEEVGRVTLLRGPLPEVLPLPFQSRTNFQPPVPAFLCPGPVLWSPNATPGPCVVERPCPGVNAPALGVAFGQW